MSLPYTSALHLLHSVATSQLSHRPPDPETLPLSHAPGRTAASDILSPVSTPDHDTSAMDGYAISSKHTAKATTERPVIFRVTGCIAAGYEPALHHRGEKVKDDGSAAERVLNRYLDNERDAIPPCLEIMTGAVFPASIPGQPVLDACVRVEDTTLFATKTTTTTTTAGGGSSLPSTCRLTGTEAEPGVEADVQAETQTQKYILVNRPIPRYANRRFAGCDIRAGQMLVQAGETIRASQVMALASAGCESVAVVPRTRVGVFSTGRELVRGRGRGGVPDVNGPYLMAALREGGVGAQGRFLGVVDDEVGDLEGRLRGALGIGAGNGDCEGGYDVVITTGAVSVGKFDYVRPVLEERLGAEIVFHGLAIRPGHPVLFALVPCSRGTGRKVAFFGLPGNPGAAAACFRFLVVPYLRAIQGRGTEVPKLARLVRTPESNGQNWHAKSNGTAHGCGHGHGKGARELDIFRHGVLETVDGELIVKPSEQQSPAKMGPFVKANCWIHYEPDEDPSDPNPGLMKCYPSFPET